MCSSSSSSFGFTHDAISSVSAWRWPPDRLPIGLSSRSSRPMLSQRTRSRSSPRIRAGQRPSEAAWLPPPRRQHEVFADRHRRRRAAEGILEDASHEPRPTVLGPRRDVHAVDPNRARIDKERPGDRVEQRRLAGTVRSHDDDERSLIDREVDALEGAQLVCRCGVERLGQLTDLEHDPGVRRGRRRVFPAGHRRPLRPGSERRALRRRRAR